MDYKFILVILLIGHFLGDFYFQSPSMLKQKGKKKRVMLAHGFIYLAVFMTPFLLLFLSSLAGWGLILLVPFLHITVDIIKENILSRKHILKKHSLALFVTAQAIHLLIAAIVAYIYATNITVAYSTLGILLSGIYANLHLGIPASQLLGLACLFLFLGKPVNIFIRKTTATDETLAPVFVAADQKAGRIIGVLERYLTAVLILLGQYAAVGLAFTAKSVTRFDKISRDPDFAEQYLIGTMSSLLFAVTGTVLYMFVL
jgi:hypothetical protein